MSRKFAHLGNDLWIFLPSQLRSTKLSTRLGECPIYPHLSTFSSLPRVYLTCREVCFVFTLAVDPCVQGSKTSYLLLAGSSGGFGERAHGTRRGWVYPCSPIAVGEVAELVGFPRFATPIVSQLAGPDIPGRYN